MQLYLCQTSCPRSTSGVMFSALVSLGNWRWLSMVSARKITVANTVQPMAKKRACRLFIAFLPSDGDAVPIVDGDERGVGDGDENQCENHISQNFDWAV